VAPPVNILAFLSFQMKFGYWYWTNRNQYHFGKFEYLELQLPAVHSSLRIEFPARFSCALHFCHRLVDSWYKLTSLVLALMMELPVNMAEKPFFILSAPSQQNIVT
jgi:hypothetical protein